MTRRSIAPHALLGSLTLTLLGNALAQDVCQLPDGTLPTLQRAVVLLDTSGSMVGKGDGKADIFAAVQGSLSELLRGTHGTGSIDIATFDSGPRSHASFSWPGERATAELAVRAHQANGSNTYLYRSMVSSFERLSKRPDTATTVYVITDGQNNDPDTGYTIHTTLRAFERTRGPFDKLYYIALGAAIPQDVKDRFASTGFARTVEVPVGRAPDLREAGIAPAILDVDPRGRIPLQLPGDARLALDAARLAGGSVALPVQDGSRRSGIPALRVTGTVKAGSIALLCVHGSHGQQNVLLHFPRTITGARPDAASGTPAPAGPRLRLLNPQAGRELAHGQRVVLRYRVEGGPMIVQLGDIPESLTLDLPDRAPEVALAEGDEIDVTVTNRQLPVTESAVAALRLGSGAPFPLPAVTSVPRDWRWLTWTAAGALIAVLLVLLARLSRRDPAPSAPVALSIDAFNVYLHGADGRQAARRLQRRVTDVGAAFKLTALRGVTVERYRAPRDADIDPENAAEVRDAALRASGRAVRLTRRSDTVELHDGDEPVTPGAPLHYRHRYTLATPAPQPAAVPAPVEVPQEPPIDVIVALTGAHGRLERELPPGTADLGAVFGQAALAGLTVRREPRALRLVALPAGTVLSHISRDWEQGEALPLGVMLSVVTPGAFYGLQVQDKEATARLARPGTPG